MRKPSVEFRIANAAVSVDDAGFALINCQTDDEQQVVLRLARETLALVCAQGAIAVKGDRRKLKWPLEACKE